LTEICPPYYPHSPQLGVIIVAMSLIAAGYVAVGVAGYAAYPTTVSSNILNTFPANDTAMQVGSCRHGQRCTLADGWSRMEHQFSAPTLVTPLPIPSET
jgi:amino acid permease